MNFERINPIWLEETDSTNAEAMRMLKQGRPTEGSCVVARFQHEGRGQRSNVWTSPPGENLLISFILYPPKSAVPSPFLLSKALALAVHQTLVAFTRKVVHIKWPNDILVDGKKAAGILLENQWLGAQWQAAVAGIGINVNQKKFILENATSVMQGLEEVLALELVIAELQRQLSFTYKLFCDGDSSAINAAYHHHLFGKNEFLRYSSEKGELRGKVVQVLDDGQLELITDNGIKNSYDLSEVRLIF
jgi:BirA family biotin operon repressor/biotin-[acetyl-CoA-carboxylase] ligase